MQRTSILIVLYLFTISANGYAVDLKLPWTSGEQWTVTVQYGGYCGSECQDNYHTNGSNGYYALDFDKPGAPEGSGLPILAAASGNVIFAGGDPDVGFGYYVKIDHGDGYVTLYGHLKEYPTVSGYVTQGTQIGKLGSTGGYSTADHLHFALYYQGDCLSSVANSKPEPMSGYTNIAYGQYLTSNNTGATYSCAVNSQSSNQLTLARGQTVQLWVKFRNTGNTTWYNNPASHPNDYVELKSCNQQGTVMGSFLNNPYDASLGWLNVESPCTMTETSVAPQGVATFSFTGKVASNAPLGLTPVYFRPNHSSGGLLQDWGGMKFDVTVVSSGLTGSDFIPLVGRFNNDTKSDVALYEPATGRFYIALSNGDNSFAPVAGAGTNGSMFEVDWDPGTGPFTPLIGDCSGDGFDDLALVDLATGWWYVAFNWITRTPPEFEESDGYYTGNAWINADWGKSPYVPFLKDCSNDGYADICVFHPTYGRWSVAYNYNDRFTPALGPALGGSWLDNWKVTSGPWVPFVSDFSNDGAADVAVMRLATGRWYVAYNDFTPLPRDFKPTSTYWIESEWGQSPYLPFIGDFNGDDSTEMGVFHPPTGRWFATFKVGKTFAPYLGYHAGGSWIDSFRIDGTYIPLVGDFSGDGFTDVCVYQPSLGRWFVAFNWDTCFVQRKGMNADSSWLTNWGIETGGSPKLADGKDERTLPTDFTLNQNYPNPFNPTTTISYTLPKAGHVTLTVYNVLGQRVTSLVDEDQTAGEHSVIFEANKYSSGIYFYRIEAEGVSISKKMLLLK